ncbi:hypothetical protein IC614_09630 [Allosphingosinicella flava]|uniref:Uncharacterized protein n=1 Tax=Allosphingosinicella flava TaxID=2771430 RepID=A0A7T2GIN3_9SPHN|nr:hypothetical protein [Sphingosinicella flava]QPQ54583.1 hypothetical protein IC614_09630 [Sphingosinicella flava]
MDSGGFSWSLITILGPILLAAVLLWAIVRNRKASRRDIERTEQATRDLYKAEDAKLDDEKI